MRERSQDSKHEDPKWYTILVNFQDEELQSTYVF